MLTVRWDKRNKLAEISQGRDEPSTLDLFSLETDGWSFFIDIMNQTFVFFTWLVYICNDDPTEETFIRMHKPSSCNQERRMWYTDGGKHPHGVLWESLLQGLSTLPEWPQAVEGSRPENPRQGICQRTGHHRWRYGCAIWCRLPIASYCQKPREGDTSPFFNELQNYAKAT